MMSYQFGSVQLLSHVQLFATPLNEACQSPCPSPTPGACQTHAHQVGDAIQPSHSLSHSPSAFSLAQHQGLFQ